jgi:hypothetical protein
MQPSHFTAIKINLIALKTAKLHSKIIRFNIIQQIKIPLPLF